MTEELHMNNRLHRRAFLSLPAAASLSLAQPPPKRMQPWGDTTRLGRPFSKDPCVIRLGGRYLMYYSLPPFGDGRANDGWGIGIAESRNLLDWAKVGEVPPAGQHESKGICAPFAMTLEGQVHLFYQTYGNGPKDAICHAISENGLAFRRDASNPIFRASGEWNSGRAIDVEVTRFHGKWFLYAATRDPKSRVQMLTGAVSSGGFAREDWQALAGGPLLRPELPWERQCIEAPSVLERDGQLFMFYAGAYNNEPQQIGCARSPDGVRWERLGTEPLLPAGPPGSWNSSESGHPAVFVDSDGETYLFYQGNPDRGRTWLLSFVQVDWRDGRPFVKP